MKKLYFLPIFLFGFLFGLLAQTKTKNIKVQCKVQYKVEPKLERINKVSFELGGCQQMFQDSITQNWLLGLSKRNPYMTGMLEDANKKKNGTLLPWSGEFAGKYLIGAVNMYRLNPNEQLKQEMDNLVIYLCALQPADGYLGAWGKEYELTGRMPSGGDFPDNWDAWNHYQIMIGLLEYNRLFNDGISLNICCKIGDRLCSQFLDQPEKLLIQEKIGWCKGNMEFNLTPAHALCLLYRTTGQPKYLRLAQQMINDGFSRYGDFLNRALAGKDFYDNSQYPEANRWERLHAIMGMAELYWLTGNDDYRKAFEQIWWSIAQTDIHNTGGFSTTEMAVGNPYAEGAVETCCTVAWQAMSVEMLKMTGNSVVADMLELAQMNASYGCWDNSGRWNTYHTGMTGQRLPSTMEIGFQIRPGTEELNCCSANAPRGVDILADWALMQKGKGLALNWYGAGKMVAKAGNVPVAISQSTNYPQNGEIQIQVNPSETATFPLELRIPFWSEKTIVSVNGENVANVEAGKYLVLNRQWKSGDVVKLTLDMRPHFLAGENVYQGLYSIYRGPILMAWRKPSQPLSIFYKDPDWRPWPGIAYFSEKAGVRMSVKFTGEQINMVYDACPEGGKLRLSIDGNEMEVLDLYSSSLKQLLSWKSPTINNGNHTLTIEILKDKNESSKGNAVRIREFSLTDLPILNARKLELMTTISSSSTIPWVVSETMDNDGNEVLLQDFSSAGKNNGYYHTWLPIKGLEGANGNFSKINPLRSFR